MATTKAQKILKEYGLLISVGVLILIALGGYLAGFRIGPGGIVHTGTLQVIDAPAGTIVYVDEIREHVVQDEALNIALLPGAHSIVVTSEGYQPWNELVYIESNARTAITPLLVPLTLIEQELAEDDLVQAQAALKASSLPTLEQPLITANGCAQVYVAGNRIIAEPTDVPNCKRVPYLCTPESIEEFGACLPTIVFEPGDALQSVVSFPGREDALIVSSNNLAYVIELDPREPRFFAPLVRDTNIRVAPWTDRSVLISSPLGPRELPL